MKLDNNNYLVSVIIPCYDNLPKLKNTLNSICHAIFQLLEDQKKLAEIILVDNNSKKRKELSSLAANFQKKVDLTLIHQPPLKSTFSLSSARNRGVLNSRGKYIFFTDDDCMISNNFFTNLIAFKEKIFFENHWVITGERVFVEAHNHIPSSIMSNNYFTNLKSCPSASNYGQIKDRRFPWIQDLPHVEHPWNFVHGCFMFMKKETYIKSGGSNIEYDGTWGYEEIDLVYEISQKLLGKIYYCDNAKVYHQEFIEDRQSKLKNLARINKAENPNWERICKKIEGFKEFKEKQFLEHNISVNF